MKQAISLLLFISIAFSLPFVGLVPVQFDQEKTLMALDVCGQGWQAGLDAAPALSEPVFELAAVLVIDRVTEGAAHVQPFLLTSLIDKPPKA